MKIFLCAIIVFVSGLIGINYKSVIYKKYQLFSEINAFLHFILIKIAFFQDTYAECLQNFINTQHLKNKNFFQNVLSLIQCGKLTRESMLEHLNNRGLTNEEKVEIYDVFSSIGTTDLLNQNQILNGHIKHLEHKLKMLDELKKTKGDVVSKLSICIGLVICILIY